MDLVPAHSAMQEQELLCSQVLQWEPFVMGLPSLVLELGRTVINCSSTDFQLEAPGKQYKLLKYQHSFRASLHQVGVNRLWR